MTDNLIPFKPKEQTKHDKIESAVETQDFICFWHNADGFVSYCIGKGITLEQQVMIEKILSVINVDTMKEQMHFE